MNRQFMSNVIRNFAEKIENGCFIKKLGGSERSQMQLPPRAMKRNILEWIPLNMNCHSINVWVVMCGIDLALANQNSRFDWLMPGQFSECRIA